MGGIRHERRDGRLGHFHFCPLCLQGELRRNSRRRRVGTLELLLLLLCPLVVARKLLLDVVSLKKSLCIVRADGGGVGSSSTLHYGSRLQSRGDEAVWKHFESHLVLFQLGCLYHIFLHHDGLPVPVLFESLQ